MPNGEGYRFLADIVIQLDPANPQIAARIVGPLGQWRRMDAGRQALMQGELNRILALPGLSDEHVRDRVQKSGPLKESSVSSLHSATSVINVSFDARTNA